MAERRIGTAGWTIPSAVAESFPREGSGLERYAAILSCAEINSSFHRSHRESTWARWAESVPGDFAFAAKLPREITHKQRLADCGASVDRALAEMRPLGRKLRILLVQLPPSLAFDARIAEEFAAAFRRRWDGFVAWEPRHPSWFDAEAEALLVRHHIARVAADPPPAPGADRPGGWPGLVYLRLHGSPARYRSRYDDGRLEGIAARLEAAGDVPAWCIFDNTASGAAAADALKLLSLLGQGRPFR
ncbi:MAG TPA: DUF72 domain-containing protein [Allosphingosinicella sp.]|nr:DUF72 domain-containing protein [Allosphingosinicella sp.]